MPEGTRAHDGEARKTKERQKSLSLSCVGNQAGPVSHYPLLPPNPPGGPPEGASD